MSIEFIASRLNCNVQNAKASYFNHLKSIDYTSEDLIESETAFGEKAKQEAVQFEIQEENTISSIIRSWSREYIEQLKKSEDG